MEDVIKALLEAEHKGALNKAATLTDLQHTRDIISNNQIDAYERGIKDAIQAVKDYLN